MPRDTSPLFEPLRLGAIHAPNRIVMAPLTRTRANAGDAVHALQAEYYAQRASAGLIVSEATQISPQGKGYAGAPGIHSQAQIDGWRGVTQAVHAAGGRMVLQLWHVGRVSHPSLQPAGALPVAPSAIGFEGYAHTYDGPQDFVVPRALETHEIPGIVDDYARAARNAKVAGFDGVEIHSANAYLLDQFLRDGTNHRTDAYGGSLENRARLTLEVTDSVVAVWGADRVGIRLSPSLTINGMSDSNPAATFAYAATELGRRKLAYMHVVEPKDPRGDPMDRLVDPMILRRAFGGPYIANSGYDADRVLDGLAEGRLDAASFGRKFIANPDLPRRLRDGLPMNSLNAERLYGGGADGYTDYPVYE
ncbi:alkene reductase [Mesorhizobium sp. B2-3-5]|uniref:alkene reductase n=1 Tax=Mesorhizobium sp. B2-3-5 TaxID=2589958 RepID=UPI0011264D98|nr:alkene reductase [Mesorhizobium sp. B2-3-5]TPM26885.1 alkene reductase [Mesorhizobium sp. B2-3-5]